MVAVGARPGTEPPLRNRTARAADRRLGGALRLAGLAALLWPFSLLLPARWLIGPALAGLVTWSLLRARPRFIDVGARRRLERCLDLVIAGDVLLLVQIVFAGKAAYSVPWLVAIALGAVVRYAGAAREEADCRDHHSVAAGMNRARIILAVTLVPAYLVVAWGPFALHRRTGAGGGLPVAGTWYVADRGWVLALGAVVIALGAGLATLTVAGHRFRIALGAPRSGKIRRSDPTTPEHT